jgi:hypothetical protein
MKNLTIKNTHEYEAFWLSVEMAKPAFVLWQLVGESERKIKFYSLQNRNGNRVELTLTEQSTQALTFSMQDLYGYCEDLSFIFKTQIAAIEGPRIVLSLPLSVKILEDEDVKFIQGLKEMNFSSAPWRMNQHDTVEEEQVYTSLREAPRARPKSEKKVSLYKTGEPDARADYRMFDISRGGLSFLMEKVDQFQKGDFIQVVALEGDELDTILIGEVMSIREKEETWKVGVKFVDKIPTQES